MELPIGATLGPYQITGLLARGGQADVYRARQPNLERDVAIKILPESLAAEEGFVDRFRREARSVTRLHHTNIVPVHDFACDGGICYFVMEYVPGPTLLQRLREAWAKNERLPLSEAARVVRAIGSALDYAHRQGMVHGNLNPANIIFNADGEPMLTDLGIARMLEGTSFAASRTLLGRPAYLSPEQCRGEKASAAGDLYSLGAILYEMVTGRVPFVANTPTGVLFKQVSEPPPMPRALLPALSPHVEQVILKALAKVPGERYASGAEMVEALDNALRVGAAEAAVALAGATAAAGALLGHSMGAREGAQRTGEEALAAETQPPVMPKTGLSASIDAFLASLRGEKEQQKEGGGRGWWAQMLALLGTAFALIQYVLQVFDLVNRPLAPLMRVLPYVIVIVLLGGVVASALVLTRPSPRRQKRIAGGALLLIAVASLTWGGWTYYNVTKPPKNIIILVADFVGREATKGADWGGYIYRQVKNDIARVGLSESVEVRRVFEEYDTSEQARARGETQKATIVLWGSYDDYNVNPHFELLRAARQYAGTLSAPELDLVGFDLYMRSGPQEMSYIVLVALGLVRYAQSDYAGAITLFSSAIAAAPEASLTQGQETAYFYRGVARLYGYAPREDAISDFKEAVARKPDMYKAHWGLAVAYANYCTPTLALDASLASAQTLVSLRPNDSEVQRVLGWVYVQREEYDKAQAAYHEAIRLDADNANAYMDLGELLWKMGRTDEAKEVHARALPIRQKQARSKPEDKAGAQYELGYSHFWLGQYEQAITAFKEAVRLAPANPYYHEMLGKAYYWQGKPTDGGPSTRLDDAIAEYKIALDLNPKSAWMHSVLASAYVEAERQEDALRELEEAVRLDPCDPDAVFLLASQYDVMGRKEEAEETYRRLTQLKPSMTIAWQYLAVAASERDDHVKAVAYYRAGLRADPDDATLHYGLGTSLYALGQYEEAEAEYRRTTELLPDDARSFAAWGDALAQLGRRADAIAAYQKSLQLDSTAYLTWISLGLQYELEQNWQEAEKAYAEAARLEPDDALTRGAHGQMLQRLNRLEEAVQEYEAAAKLDPSAWIYHESLALLYAALNRPGEALAAAETTVKLKPDDALAHLIIAGVSEDKGDKERARAEYELALQYAGENAGLKKLAEDGLKRVGK